jgi:general nucleoside transport system permease protein
MTRTVDRDVGRSGRPQWRRGGGERLSEAARQLRRAQASLLAVAMGILIGAVVVLAIGENPVTVYVAMLGGAFDRFGLPLTLSRAVPIVGAGLAAAVAFRAGFITLGVEGQMVLGGLSAALTTIALADAGVLALPLGITAAVVVGAGFAGLAAWFWVRYGVPILISTLLMNYPAVLLASYLVSGPLGEPVGGVSQTALVPPVARLGELATDTRLNVGALIVLALLVGLAVVMNRAWLGYEIRMTGLNPLFSQYGGIGRNRLCYKVMLASGGIAGLVGSILTLGIHYRFIDGALTGPLYAWIGLMAALLAESNPVGVLVAGVFFAALQTGALEVERSTDVARELSLVLQSVIIILVASRWAFRARGTLRSREHATPEPELA